MIPAFDPATGNLPPGIHEATWDEVVARYGHTPHRLALLTGFKAALDALRIAGCPRVYLDGSFVGTTLAPGDYDACWDMSGVDLPRLALLAPVLFDFHAGRRAQKAHYGGELFPMDASADAAGTRFLDFFQRDKDTNQPKGIIAIDLGGLP